MRKLTLSMFLCALVVAPGCLRSTTDATIKTDGSGTVTYDTSYRVEAVAQARERMEEMRARAEEAGREFDAAPMEQRIDAFLSGFDADKIAESLKGRGLVVTKSEAYEAEGWKGARVTATFKDVNEVIRLTQSQKDAQAAREREAAEAQGGEGGGRRGGMRMMGRMGGGAFDTDPTPAFIVSFQKTADEKIGKAVLVAARPPRPEGGRGGEGGGRRGGGRGGMGGGGMQGMEDYKRTLKITLPGEIAETSRCKKEGPSTVLLNLRGTDLQPDEDGNMPGIVTDGASVTFQIPEGCAIKFDDPTPKKAATEEKKDEAPAPDDAKKKKGDLRVGGGQD